MSLSSLSNNDGSTQGNRQSNDDGQLQGDRPNFIGFSIVVPLSGNSGASVVVFAPAAVTLPQSWPWPRACAAEVRGPPAEPGESPGSVRPYT